MGTPAVYIDYLRLAVDGRMIMGAGLQYDIASQYNYTTRDYTVGSPIVFPTIIFSAGMT